MGWIYSGDNKGRFTHRERDTIYFGQPKPKPKEPIEPKDPKKKDKSQKER